MTDQIPAFKRSIDTQTVVDRLRASEIGDLVTYASISEALGRDVTNGARSVLQSARRIVLNEDQMVFGVVTRVGLKRLSDVEIVDAAHSSVRHVNRTAKRSARKLACVQRFSELPADKKLLHQTHMTLFSAIGAITKESGVKKLEGAVNTAGDALPLGKTLEAFKK